jgi:CheY-like chemotaxis protein
VPTILVVDDDAIDREQAGRCLKSIEDLTLVYAQDGREAIRSLTTQLPDLVITDLRMPRMDGLELVGSLREEHPSLPVILMTSRGSEEIAVRALKAGAASYVPKRDLARDLVDTVHQVLEVVAAGRSRQRVVQYLKRSESHFDLANDPELISPLVGFLQDSLQRIDFGSSTTRIQVGMAVAEALSNAMIHGNLEVGSHLRDQSIESYYRLIEERRGQEPYARRRVRFTASESPDRIDYVVEDEGPGFDRAAAPRAEGDDDRMRVRGRGLVLIRAFMDAVEHNSRGNRITMTRHGHRPPSEI